jgi:hypothetical protein
VSSRHTYNQKTFPSSFATGAKPLNVSSAVFPKAIFSVDRQTVMQVFAAVIGWVPYLKDSQMPMSAFKTLISSKTVEKGSEGVQSLKERTALYLLFLSGNPTDDPASNPNPDGLDEEGFLTLSKGENYRAMLGVKNLKINWTAKGEPISVVYDFLPVVGYTLFRAPFSSAVLYSSLGRTEVETWDRGFQLPNLHVQATSNGNQVNLDLVYRFMLGKLPDWIAHKMTGNWAPWAWLKIRFRIAENRVSVSFTGSAIPSQSEYANGAKVEGSPYNMIHASPAALDVFMKTGRKRDAAERGGEKAWFHLSETGATPPVKELEQGNG